jgi:C4-type Zn-finger protein
MATIEGIMNVLEDDVHTLWKFHSEQHKLEKSSLEGHVLLLQLNDLQR